MSVESHGSFRDSLETALNGFFLRFLELNWTRSFTSTAFDSNSAASWSISDDGIGRFFALHLDKFLAQLLQDLLHLLVLTFS